MTFRQGVLYVVSLEKKEYNIFSIIGIEYEKGYEERMEVRKVSNRVIQDLEIMVRIQGDLLFCNGKLRKDFKLQ